MRVVVGLRKDVLLDESHDRSEAETFEVSIREVDSGVRDEVSVPVSRDDEARVGNRPETEEENPFLQFKSEAEKENN